MTDGTSAEAVRFRIGDVQLPGQLTVPADSAGVVVFAQVSGTLSPRNEFLVGALNQGGFATLQCDLLTPEEAGDLAKVYGVRLLAGRLVGTLRWVREQPALAGQRIGLFGEGPGAAAALWATTEPDVDVQAVVCRSGRPDLAAARLPMVRVPTLFVVGGQDRTVVKLNRQAQRQMHCQTRLEVVAAATQQFSEPGALTAVATLAMDWFHSRLRGDEGGDDRRAG